MGGVGGRLSNGHCLALHLLRCRGKTRQLQHLLLRQWLLLVVLVVLVVLVMGRAAEARGREALETQLGRTAARRLRCVRGLRARLGGSRRGRFGRRGRGGRGSKGRVQEHAA